MSSPEKPRLLLILGAGASYCRVPNTLQLTDIIREHLAEEPCSVPLMEWLAEQSAGKNANFEDWIDLIDGIVDLGYGASGSAMVYRDQVWSRVVQANAKMKGIVFPHPTIDESVSAWRKLALDLRTRVLEAVEDPSSPSQASINRIVQALLSQFDLTIVSLNYDPLLDAGTVALDHGFNIALEPPRRYTGSTPFSWYRFDASFETRPPIVGKVLFLPLHGSVRFANLPSIYPDGEPGDPKAHALEPVWAADLSQVRAARSRLYLNNSNAAYRLDPRMVTGRRKLDQLVLNPYAAYWTRFRHEATMADAWLVVGYSGNDEHVNTGLGNAWRIRTSAGLPPRFVLADYGDPKHGSDLLQHIQSFHRFQWRIDPGGSTNSSWVPWHELVVSEWPLRGWYWGLGVDALAVASEELLDKLEGTEMRSNSS